MEERKRLSLRPRPFLAYWKHDVPCACQNQGCGSFAVYLFCNNGLVFTIGCAHALPTCCFGVNFILVVQVLKAVQCEEAMVWSTFPGVRFQGTECLMDSLPMLRCLATDSWQHKLAWPTLETPNMIFGCAAGGKAALVERPCTSK